jgi:pyruvate/2-oxoglutarate/acetoin dehydrogenase E1 component
MTGSQFNILLFFTLTASAGQLGATHSQALSGFANTPGLNDSIKCLYDARAFEINIRDNDPVILWNQGQMYGDKVKYLRW